MRLETRFSDSAKVACFRLPATLPTDDENYIHKFLVSANEFAEYMNTRDGKTLVFTDDSFFIEDINNNGQKINIYFLPVSKQMIEENDNAYVEYVGDLGNYPVVCFHKDDMMCEDDVDDVFLDLKNTEVSPIAEMLNLV